MSKPPGRRRLLGMKSLLLSLMAATGLAVAPILPRPSTPQDPTPKAMTHAPQITPFLWFDDDAEQAVAFYTALIPDSKVLSQTRWGDGGPVPKGTLMTATFTLAGREYMALNGGPHFHLNEAFSLFVACEDQAEVDHYWQALTADGGVASMCGWLQDKFGLSWQIVPKTLVAMLTDRDPTKAARVSAAMLQMQKLDVAALQRAYDGN